MYFSDKYFLFYFDFSEHLSFVPRCILIYSILAHRCVIVRVCLPWKKKNAAVAILDTFPCLSQITFIMLHCMFYLKHHVFDSLLLKTDLDSSHHVWKKCIQRCYSIFCLESKKRLISIVIWQTVPWPGQILLLQVFLSPMNKNQIKLYFCSCFFFFFFAFTTTFLATIAAILP